MREFVAKVTRRGQLTLPVAVRRLLGLEPGDRVSIVIEDENGVLLRRIDHDVMSVRGLIPTPPGMSTDDFDELIEQAMADHADAVVRRIHAATG